MPTITRRQLLRSAAGSATLLPFAPGGLADLMQPDGNKPRIRLPNVGTAIGATPIVSTRLADNLSMLGTGRQRHRPQRIPMASSSSIRSCSRRGRRSSKLLDGLEKLAGEAADRYPLALRPHRQQPAVWPGGRGDPGSGQHQWVAERTTCSACISRRHRGRASHTDVRRPAQAADEWWSTSKPVGIPPAHTDTTSAGALRARQCAPLGRCIQRRLPVHRCQHGRQHQRANRRGHPRAQALG